MNIFGLGTMELLLIVFVLLLLFGKDRLPELAKSIGRSVNSLRTGFSEKPDVAENEQSKPKGKA